MKKATIVSASFIVIAAAFTVTVLSGILEKNVSDFDVKPFTKEEMREKIQSIKYDELQSESVEEKSSKNDSDSVSISFWGSQGYWSGSTVKQVNQIIVGL